MVVSGGVVSTVNVALAGVPSCRPAASIARTRNVCWAWVCAGSVIGVVQAAYAALSTWHWNVVPASEEVNWNVGVLSFVSPVGPAVIVVFGGVVSTVNVCVVAVGF